MLEKCRGGGVCGWSQGVPQVQLPRTLLLLLLLFAKLLLLFLPLQHMVPVLPVLQQLAPSISPTH